MLLRVLASFFATIVSNGIARYGYVVLIPVLILEQKLSEKESVALALAVLFGYIFGSYFVAFLKRFLSIESIAQLAFFLTSFSFFVCAMDFIGFLWLFIWRFIAGFACSALIILSMPLVLPYIKDKYKESISGFIFAGVGIGVLLAGFSLPFLAHISINLAWLSMGFFSFVLFVFSLFAFREKTKMKNDEKSIKLDLSLFFILLLVSYILNSIGFLPHSIFWADYMVRELDFNTILAGSSYSFFGFGCLFGSLLAGILAQKFSVKSVHIVIILLKAYACFLAISTTNLHLLNLSVFFNGLWNHVKCHAYKFNGFRDSKKVCFCK